MKLLIKENNEHALQVGPKELSMWWCPEHQVFECICEIADLKGENGLGLPRDAMLILAQDGKRSFHSQGGAYVFKRDVENQTMIHLQYGIPLKGVNESIHKNLHSCSNQEPDKAYIDKLLKHFHAVSANEDFLCPITFVPLDKEFYQAIIKDLDFIKKFLGLN